jgi:hypothetical protein
MAAVKRSDAGTPAGAIRENAKAKPPKRKLNIVTPQQQSIPMPMGATKQSAAEFGAALAKLAAEDGPYRSQMAAESAGWDKDVAALSKTRANHPLHYWLNPLVPGPLTELRARMNRRRTASNASSGASAAVGALTNPTTLGGGFVRGLGDGLAAPTGIPVGSLATLGISAGQVAHGGAKAQQKAHQIHKRVNEPHKQHGELQDDNVAMSDRAFEAGRKSPAGMETNTLAKAAVEGGPLDLPLAGAVAGHDDIIAGLRRNRTEKPLHYWLNPFVGGPVTELAHRGARRIAAGAHDSWPGLVGGVATGGLYPLITGGQKAQNKARDHFKRQVSPEEAGLPPLEDQDLDNAAAAYDRGVDTGNRDRALASRRDQLMKKVSSACEFGAALAMVKLAGPPGLPRPPAAAPAVTPNAPATGGQTPGGLGRPPGLVPPGGNVVSGRALGGATMASPAATAGLRGPARGAGPSPSAGGGAGPGASAARPAAPAQSAFSRLPAEAQQRYQAYAQRETAAGRKPVDEAGAAAYYSRNYMGGKNYQDKVVRKDDPTQGRAAVAAQQKSQGQQRLQARTAENAANLERMPANTNRFMSDRTHGQLLQANMARNAANPSPVRPGSPQAPQIATPPVSPRPNPRQTPGPAQFGQQMAMA